MRSQVDYEWTIEVVDEHGDITDCDFADKLLMFSPDQLEDALVGEDARLGLVRNVGNDVEGLLDRTWAYLKGKELEPVFSDGCGCYGAKVPKKFMKELEEAKNNVPK